LSLIVPDYNRVSADTKLFIKYLDISENIGNLLASNIRPELLLDSITTEILRLDIFVLPLIFLIDKQRNLSPSKNTKSILADAFTSYLLTTNQSQFSIPLNVGNLLINSYMHSKVLLSDSFYDLLKPVFPESLVTKVQTSNGIQVLACLPLSNKTGRLGCFTIGIRQPISKEIIGMLTNFTIFIELALKQLAESKLKTKLALLAQNQEKMLLESIRREKDIVDIIAHELRTPFATTRNAALLLEGFLKEKEQLEPEYVKEISAILVESLQRQAYLLNRIFLSAEVASSKVGLNYETINVSELIRKIIPRSIDAINNKKLNLKLNLGHNLKIETDKYRLEEAISNIIDNAIKYTQKGDISITLENYNNKIIIFVSDTGIGIDVINLKYLGRKFYRVNKYLTADGFVNPGGTGLGIYISVKFINSLEGKVFVKSLLNQGTSFAIVLKKVVVKKMPITQLDKFNYLIKLSD